MKQELINKIIGGHITHISRVCDMISFGISSSNNEHIYLHVQSFLRILNNTTILASTEDLYKPHSCVSEENFEWDVPGNSAYDESIKKIETKLFNSTITEFNINEIGDVNILLDNNFKIEILIDTTISLEKYRISDKVNDFVFYST